MPLSEALAARRHVNRPWWRRATQSIDHHIPLTLRGRWTLSLPAATALALIAVAGAATGGWYLTRSQGTVVDVGGVGGGGGGGNAGEAAASDTGSPDDTTDAPTNAHAKPLAAPPGGVRNDGACRSRPRTSATPRALTPSGWSAHAAKPSPVSFALLEAPAGLVNSAVLAAPAAGATGALSLRLPHPEVLVATANAAMGWTATGSRPLPVNSAGAPPAPAGQIAPVPGPRPLDFRRLTAVPAAPTGRPAHLGPTPPAAPSFMDRWRRAPIARHYLARASKYPSCASRNSMSANPAPASTSAVVVDVEGKVAHPGIETLPAGSRVYEALAAAGGALPGVDVTALDLARPVADGEQLRVGIAGAPSPVVGLPQPSRGRAARGKRGKTAQPVNLNTATLEQLESVPDVGPALAQRILDWRAEHGRFTSVSQLRGVRGIGDRKFADMRDSVTV